MYPKSKIVILLLCLVLLFNTTGCFNDSKGNDSDKEITSSEEDGTGSQTSEPQDDLTTDDTDTSDSTPDNMTDIPNYSGDDEDTYKTDRYIPTASDSTDIQNEWDKEIETKAVSWNGPKGYVIVVPKGSDTAYESAQLLKDYYKKNASVDLQIVTDDAAAKDKEILIGNTARYKYTAKEGEYFAKVSGNKLIFGGGHDVTVKKAVQIQTRLKYQSGKAYEYDGSSDFINSKFGYTYVWGDEFEGTAIDGTLWSRTTSMSATSEMALDDSEQTAFLKNGYLNMLAIRYWDPKKAGIEYAAPWAVTTQETMSYKYGYVEIRAKLPFVRGAWPSFWAVSSNALGPKTAFDYYIEVDIFENFASLDTISPNIHKWYDDGEHTQWADENEKYTFSSTDINNEFHTYGFEWTPEKMTMYIDDKPYYTYDLSVNFDGGSSGMGGFDTQLYLLFNNHLFTASSDYLPYDGCEIYPTDVPTEYVIDYVRLYQKKDGISKLYTN